VTTPDPDRRPEADPSAPGPAAWDGPPWGGPPWARAHGDRGEWQRRWGRRRAGRPAFGFLGCLLVVLVLFVGVVAALATWVAAALLGVLSPGAAPPTATAVAIVVVLVLALALGARFFLVTVRPMAELAAASERLADGEPGVRVEPRGPGPVRRAGASFNAMAERLDRSRDDRRALLADVTHELRTPLTVISGGLEAMLDGVHPMDEDHIAPILAEAEVMDRLLDDLRTISLAEAGALPLHREPVDLVDIVDEVLAAQRTAADARRVALARTGDDELEADVDPVRVREILVNLVANAVRHTPAGGHVTVDVRADGGDAVLTVNDTGEGIPADELRRVFDRFHRRSDSGGSGLGLTIVRDLAAAHGGSVDVSSEGVPGRGSTFRVRLPRRL
jgi:two-component system sensor histidine kinase BaeS